MIDPRAAMEPGLEAHGVLSNVMQQPNKPRIPRRAEAGGELCCQLRRAAQMRRNALLPSAIGNMRKISHKNHRKIVVFYKDYNADMRKLQAPRHKILRRNGVF